MKWLVIWYDGNRQRAALVDDRVRLLPHIGGASGALTLMKALAGPDDVEDFQVNAVVEIHGELGLVVLDGEEVAQVPHVVLGA